MRVVSVCVYVYVCINRNLKRKQNKTTQTKKEEKKKVVNAFVAKRAPPPTTPLVPATLPVPTENRISP